MTINPVNKKLVQTMLDFQSFISTQEKLNPDMLKLARESRGLTQKELCEKMGIRQGTISKIENRLLPFHHEIAERAISALDYPISFFTRTNKTHPLSVSYYRRNLSLSAKTLQQVEAKLDIARLGIEQLLDSVEYPASNFFIWNVEKHGEPERAAKSLRELWRVPKGPIHKLVELIEDNGVLIVAFDFGIDSVDGFAVRAEHNIPIIFFNRNMPGDRRRLTIAHELGHLIMHIGQVCPENRDEEEEAFRFANEFLVPESEFSRSFSRLDLATLAGMKQYWFVSMRSLIKKSEQRGLITANQARYLWSQMAKNNYIKREPASLDIPLEEPTLMREIIEVHQTELDYTIDQLAESVSLNPKEFLQIFFQEKKSPFQVIIKNPDHQFRPTNDTEKTTMKRVK